MNTVSEIFTSRLPNKPYCADELRFGLKIRQAANALSYRHIQPNTKHMLAWLVFDLDFEGAAFAWEKAGLPQPTIIVINPKNAHAHLFYGLESPVCISSAGRDAPKKYAEAIKTAFTLKLGADPDYHGLIAKNPLHTAWKVIWAPRLYDLSELAEYVSLPKKPRKYKKQGVGRNCTLFNEVRFWAYPWVREYQNNGASFEQWRSAVLHQAERLNEFRQPLRASEVRAVAKSVAKGTWSYLGSKEFSETQSKRGKLGGRPKTTTRDGKPWETLGVSRATYYRKVKNGLIASG